MLLQTKLFQPVPPSRVVVRTRLFHLIEQSHTRRLTLVSASAGFGKTTLVAAWLQEHSTPTTWVTLDARDNDMQRFLLYLVAAFQQVDATLGGRAQVALQTMQSMDVVAVLTLLINDLSDYGQPVTFVFDDYHVITERAIHDAVAFLLDHTPASVHLVIITRHDPPLPLARWRVRGQLLEVRSDDLRCTSDEAAHFLADTMDVHLSPEAIQLLKQRTEGWIAGLQLAALALRSRADANSFIQQFSGSDRFVADYLLEEVLQQQPNVIRLFLLCTSVVQRFTAELCQALLTDLLPQQDVPDAALLKDCQSLIVELESANLFIVPLDEQRKWYRYHHLFADLLRYRLRRVYPALESQLYQRASAWHERADNLDEAMQYALMAEDANRVCALLEQHGIWLITNGYVGTITSWLAQIPATLVQQHPLLCMIGGWAYLLTSRVNEAEILVECGEQQADRFVAVRLTREGYTLSYDDLRANFAGQRAFIARSHNHSEQAIRYARDALVLLAEQEAIVTPALYLLLGQAYWQRGEMELAIQSLTHAAAVAHRVQHVHIAVAARSTHGNILADQGDLATAVRLYREAIAVGTYQQTRQPLPPVAYPMLGMAWTHYRWNDQAAAESYMLQVERLARQGGLAIPLLWVYLLQARKATYSFQKDAAEDWIAQATTVVEHHSEFQRYRLDVAVARAQLALQQGQIREAEYHLQQCGVSFTAFRDKDVRTVSGYEFFERYQSFLPTLARLLLAQHAFDRAHELLDWLASAAALRSHTVVGIQAALFQALTYDAQHQPVAAQDALTRALELAAPSNLQQVILEAGASVTPLVQKLLPSSPYSSFIQQLLESPLLHSGKTSPTLTGLAEPLTERETQILRLLAAGLNSTEVASQLTLAPSTVRSYIKNLYSKLQVNRRLEAVEKARELHLL